MNTPVYEVVDGEVYTMDAHNQFRVLRVENAETGELISIRFEPVD